MRISYLTAALAATCLSGFAMSGGAAQAAHHDEAYRLACGSGYHTDRQGNCQSNVAETSRYCPPGEIYNPFPGGWYCTGPGDSRTFRSSVF